MVCCAAANGSKSHKAHPFVVGILAFIEDPCESFATTEDGVMLEETAAS